MSAASPKKTWYICLEGTEGVGKTTLVGRLVEHFRNAGYHVLHTKEPGTDHLPVTNKLRAIMLDQQYDAQLGSTARELISQAIRAAHIEKLILPAMGVYDFIIQDRGLLSSLAYGEACNNSKDVLTTLASIATTGSGGRWNKLYDQVILLHGDTLACLSRARACKQEFAAGDAMEARGGKFMLEVSRNMVLEHQQHFPGHPVVDVTGKRIEDVFTELLRAVPAPATAHDPVHVAASVPVSLPACASAPS
jgi:thymidylate kinase